MQIKNGYKKLLKIFITISVLECLYLFALPPVVNYYINKPCIKNKINRNINADLQYTKLKIKTHILPYITFNTKNLSLLERESQKNIISADNLDIKFSIFSLLAKKVNLKHIYSSNANINLFKDKDGNYNINNIFKKNEKSKFKFQLNKIKVKDYSISIQDDQYNQIRTIIGSPLIVKNKQNKYISIKTQGESNNSQSSSFDIDVKVKYPLDYKKIGKDTVSGHAVIYNVDLAPVFPVVNQYTQGKITQLSGYIDYLQLSADKRNNAKSNQISLNTNFHNLVFDMQGWKNYVMANGENKFDTSIDLYDNIIKVNSLKYLADNVDIKGNGTIKLAKKPVLDVDIEVKNSRTENIASILPPNMVPQYMTIEKIKNYGVYGDINGKVNIKGEIPQPDITGWVKGRDIHVLDKSIHKLHKGTVDITFDKRILNMDILVEMFNNQRAEIKGHTYMFRDGINDVTIKTTDNIDFPLAQKIVVPVSKVLNFMLGPIPDMNITSGKGIIDVHVRGSIDMIDMNGYCSFDKASLSYKGLYADIYNGKGRVDFKGDEIFVKSDRVYVKNNFVNIDGKVKINDNLDFNVSSNKVEAEDLLELINKSDLLKDVKAGLAIITKAKGPLKVGMNITAKIVPVPFGQPPLPPDEAFEDMRVKGNVDLFGNIATIIGFDTPIHNIKGNVDFTETVTTINNIDAECEKSPINIKGKVINDIKTKIPDVDIIITSPAVYLGDTVKFLTKSYLYPDNYPDLSSLYNLNSQHDLYFKYKAKSVDFLTNKAFAEMNFINDETDSPLKAKNGKITMKNANVYVDNVNADMLGSNLNIDGIVQRVDTINPIYNIDVKADKFNLENLNNASDFDILPEEAKSILNQFSKYKGFADINFELKKNIINGTLNLFKPEFIHTATSIPFNFDDFSVSINNDKVTAKNISAFIDNMPFFGDVKLSNIYKNPDIDSYFTLKLSEKFFNNYLPKEISEKTTLIGDINLSAEIKGSQDNLNIYPKLKFYPDSDITIDNISLGETNDTREFSGDINLTPNKLNVRKLDFIKYITSQNNTVNPVLFATGGGILNIDKVNNIYEPEEIHIKTEKNLSAKLLNAFLKKPIVKQGSLNCDLKYKADKIKKTATIKGKLDSQNLDIPLFDTVIKSIRINSNDEDININLFGFLNDSAVRLTSTIANNIYTTPKIKQLTLSADEIDNDKILRSLAQARKAMTTNNEIKNVDFKDINVENAQIDIKKLIIKSLVAENLKSDFSIDENGIFNAENITVDVGQGNIEGKLKYDLNNSAFHGDFELTNVDANYITETVLDGKNQIYGNANGKIVLSSQGTIDEEIIQNLNGLILFEITDGRMPKLGSLEYLLRASNIIKSGITGLTINSVLGLLNLVKTGYFSNINGSCIIENGVAKDIEIYSTGENLSLYIQGSYDIANTNAEMEILGKLSKRISTIFGAVGNTSLNTFFKLIPGISLLDFGRKDIVEDVEKIPPFTDGDYDARIFQAIINGDINSSKYVQSFKWVKN